MDRVNVAIRVTGDSWNHQTIVLRADCLGLPISIIPTSFLQPATIRCIVRVPVNVLHVPIPGPLSFPGLIPSGSAPPVSTRVQVELLQGLILVGFKATRTCVLCPRHLPLELCELTEVVVQLTGKACVEDSPQLSINLAHMLRSHIFPTTGLRLRAGAEVIPLVLRILELVVEVASSLLVAFNPVKWPAVAASECPWVIPIIPLSRARAAVASIEWHVFLPSIVPSGSRYLC
mmetsp:Transcript_21958/g.50149  ORF Transcript_21958/g.50149 Transcript_21958/m.50149 type:complete len:232 (+) Transcript_21958:1931-2626(+)